MNRLTKWCTFTKDVLNFYANLGLNWQPMPSCDIGKNSTWVVEQHFLVLLQWMIWEIFNPLKHCTLIHPCIFLTMVLTANWKCWNHYCNNPTILFTFENQYWRQLCSICTHCHCKSGPSCVLCESVGGDSLYHSHLQCLFGVRDEENRIQSILIMYLFTICLTFVLISRIKSNAYATCGG